MKKIINILTMIASTIGIVAAMDAVPFLPQELSIFIIGLAGLLNTIIIFIGDFLDDGKLNHSFEIK